jgi:acetyltransferase-like isoleucine patch superfamily enzyme
VDSSYTLGELAKRFGLTIHGNADTMITGVGTLASAGEGQLAFLANSKYSAQLARTRASAVVLGSETLAQCPVPALVAGDPYLGFARIAALFEQRSAPSPGAHPTAVIADGARVAENASIGPYCVIADGAVIGDGAELGPHCMVGPGCEVGAQSRRVARVTLVQNVKLGCRVLVHPGAVIGSDGFGIAMDDGHWTKIPQLGGVQDVRGFQDNTLGPRAPVPGYGAYYSQPIGGAFKVKGTAQMYLPIPALRDVSTARVAAFVDVGNVYKDYNSFNASDLRASVGLSLQWQAPIGPLVINFAIPVRSKPSDNRYKERIQFTFGNTF